MNQKKELLWQMTSEQFAAFDLQLYLDTHPDDPYALEMFNKHRKAGMRKAQEYESLYGPLSSDSESGDSWLWCNDPWPWEREAN